MYGTVARLKPNPGELEALLGLMAEFERERRPRIKGAVANYIYRLDDDPDTLILAVIFTDRESYMANADDPEQDAWYQKMRAHLREDPVWEDGEIVYSS